MANGIFGFGPMGALPDAQPVKPEDKRSTIEGIASQHQIPANVLMALDEAGISDTATVAQKIAADIKTGKTIDQIVGPDLMNRAYDIADQLYPRPAAPAPETGRPKEANALRDVPAAIGASVAGAVGSSVRGVGEALAGAADLANEYVANPIIEGFTGKKDAIGKAPNPLDAPAQAIGGDKGLSGFLDSYVSEDVKRDIADLTDPNADLFQPSTWKMGPRPTVRGTIYSAIDVFGSMAPVVIVGALTRSPAAAAAAGGSMSAGDAAGNAGQVIDAMAANKLPDGRSQLEAESSVYQRLVASGMPPQEAVAVTKRRAEQQSALFAAIPGALGGAATQKILSGAEGIVAGLPWGGRVAATAALSGAEEGTQEVAEGIAGRAGINRGAGLNRSVTEGTLNEAVLGALGGAPMGAIGGAFSQREQNTAGDGSAGGQGVVDAMGLPGPDAPAAPANDMPPPPPTGPIGRAAAVAPDLTPQPEAPPPAQFFPDQKPGAEIKLYDPEAEVTHNAVFLGEGPDGVSVRVAGEEITLTPQEFDQSRNEAIRLEEEAKAAAKGGKKPAKPKAEKPAAPPVPAAVDLPPAPITPGGPDVPAQPVLADSTGSPQTPADAGSGDGVASAGGQIAVDQPGASASGEGSPSGPGPANGLAGAVEASKPNDPLKTAPAKPPVSVAPMESDPGKRIQPDLLGGEPVTEATMAKKERSRREWGKLLGIAEHGKSSEDMELEGRTAILRPGKVVIRAKADAKSDLDRTIDTAGMGRDEIAAAVRGALQELDRVAPLPKPVAAEAQSQLQPPAPTLQPPAKAEVVAAPKPAQGVQIENIRDKAAVLRGVPKDAPPVIEGVRLKWDDKDGGFVFARKHAEKVRAAVASDQNQIKTSQPAKPAAAELIAMSNGKIVEKKKPEDEAEAKPKQKQIGTNASGKPLFEDLNGVRSYVDGGVRVAESVRLIPGGGFSVSKENRGGDFLTEAERAPTPKQEDAVQAVPTAAEVKAAAAVADPKPTDAQKEAGNYQMGHIMWNGLDITIETAKGALRTGKDSDGEAWSVKMPAHYGYIKRTTGADGDHIDVYMGDHPESDIVVVVDQVDADTGQFDEVKVILGSANVLSAFKIYVDGFSDGRGEDRARSISVTDIIGLQAYLASGKSTKPFAGTKGAAWSLPSPTLQSVAERDGSLPKSELPILPQLRGAGDNNSPNSDELSSILGDGGAKTNTAAPTGSDQQRQGLRTGKPALAHQEGAGAQYAEKSPSDRSWGDKDVNSLGGSDESSTINDPLPTKQGDDRGTSGNDTSKGQRKGVTSKPAGLKGLTEAENAKLAELQARFKNKMKNQINSGLDPEMVAIAVEMGALYVKSGIRRFRALVESMMNDMGLTLEQAQPYARNAYNQLRGDMELNGEDIADMDTDAEVIAEVRKMRAAEAKAPKEAAPSPDAAESAKVDSEDKGEASNDAGAAIYESSSSELEGPSPEPVSDVSAGEPTGTRGAEGEQDRISASGEADGTGDAKARGGRNSATGDGEPAAKRGVKAKRPKKAAVSPDDIGPITADAPKVQAAKVNVPAVNFTITDDVRLGKGGMAEKFSDNLAAIRTLKQIERENRRASPAEQAIMARYVGWGGMKNAFRVAGSKGAEGIAKGWEKRAAELEEMLEPAEYAAARNSTKAAHYTSQSVVKAIWEGARRLGFRGGAVLEPSVGSGNFLGLMPQDLRGPSRVTAVEYDAITAGIAKLLYPASNVLHSGFEKLPIPKGSQSLAIGNPPFGKDQLYFRHNPEVNRKTIHNQFFLASMDSLAPGGILAMVVSHYLMDSLDSTNRLAMAERAELLHAIRLPSNAFEENANTEVVTDILFFRKHDAADVVSALNASMYHGRAAADVRVIMAKKEATREQIDRTIELMAKNDKWVGAETINDPAGSGETINVNSYFLRNKGKVIGRLDASGTMNGRAGLNVKMDDPAAFAEQLNAAIAAIPEMQPVDGIVERTQAGYAAMSESLILAARNAEPGEVRVDENGALKMVIDAETLGDSKAMLLELDLTEDTPWHPDYSYRADRKWQITEDVTDENGKPLKQNKADGTPSNRNQKRVTVLESTAAIPAKRKWGAKRIEVLKALIPIKQLMKRQFVLESQDGTDQQIESNREKLNAAYDAFVKKHGKLNAKATAEIAFQMPDGALALGAEVVGKDGSISKSAIMSERITRPFVMADKADTPADALAISLSERGAIDIDRVASLLGVDVEKAGEVLSSGESPLAFYDPESEAWETADAYLSGTVKRKLYAARQAGLSKNVAALEAVQPKQWDSTQISPNIGSTWIPPSIYRDFLKHLGYSSASMSFMSVTNTFSGDVDGDAKPVWQTTGRAFSPSEIVMRLLNSLPMKVTYTDSEKRTHVDEQASVESQQKATEISSEFLDWVYQDANRREALVETFNERYNTRVIRQRDGSHLRMPTKGPWITLRRHQINAIWRGITDKAVLYDHAVGAGKTFTAIARIMERRRMGLSRKPMVVVPNHLIEQWAADFKVLYPGANVLAAGKADFETNNRRRLFAKIASGDYDAVIIGHSSFNFIDIDPSTEMRFLEEELRAANEAIKEAEEAAAEEGLDQGWRKPMGVAEAERLVTKIQTRLDKLREGKRDRLLTFEEMGIDDLTVDESHEFKNLAYSSRLQNVSGMGNKNGSAKATNLHLKARSLHEREGTSMAFLSGTPISNSVSEMYLILRNLVPNELREMGLENFDAWRSAFVSVATQWEPTESGGLKEVARLGREWTNMRALMDLYYSVADAVPIDDVIKNYPLDNGGKRFPIPPVKSKEEGKGDREMVAVKPDEAQRSELRAIVSGFESLPGMEVKERNAERLRLMDRARKVSLDARAVNPHAKVADGTGKIGATVENVMRLYKKWDEDKGTQVVFLDRSVPKAKGAEKFVAEYDDLLEKLRMAEAEEKEKDIEKLVEKISKFDPNEVEAQRVAIAGGWNAYSEIRRQLVAKGIPAEEIAFVQDANTDAEKKELFERVNSGEVRVILGSTPRMGAGTNIQKRLVGLHHVDVTWKPSDIEQREGRIVRFGNELLDKYGFDLFKVEVIAYATEMTVDAKMWALNSTKLKAINGIRKYDGSFNMEFEDEESANMAEMAALATGNPLMVERVMLDGELKKLDMSRRTFNNRMNGMRAELDRANKTIASADGNVAIAKGFADDLRSARKAALDRAAQRKIDINGKILKDSDSARAALAEEIARQRAGDENARWSVQIDGNKVTTADTANAEISRIFGTPGFEAAVNGRTDVSFSRASAAIADHINRTVAAAASDEGVAIDGITILGMPVEVDSYQSPYARDPSDRTVSFSFLHEKKEAWSTDQDAPKGTITQQGVRAALERIFERMTPEQQEGNAAYYADQKVQAIEKKPELEAEIGKPWPLAEDYEKKKTRQAEVIALLENASVNDQLGEAEDEAKESRFDNAAPVPVVALRDISAALAAEVKASGLEGKVSPALVRNLLGSAGVPIQGRQAGAVIEVSAESADPVGVMRHEIIHALRNAALWGKPYGLFTAEEWRELVKVARADADLMARVKKAYADKSESVQIEEAVAEMYREWAGARAAAGPMARAFNKIAAFFRAFASSLRGEGFTDAAMIMDRIASGTVGGRGPDGGGRRKRSAANVSDMEMRGGLIKAQDKFKGMVGSRHWKNPGDFVSNLITDAMAGKGGGDYSTLALVPGRALFSELGKRINAARAYLRQKEEMDSQRNDWHARADKVAQRWLAARNKNPDANDKLMDLMHRSTLEQVDPSMPDTWKHAFDAPARREVSAFGDDAPDWAKDAMRQIEKHEAAYAKLSAEFNALPQEFRQIYRTVKGGYDALGDAFEQAVLNNIKNATQIGLKRAVREHEKEIARIRDEALQGDERDEAIAAADAKLKAVKMRGGFAAKARMAALRKKFESNKLKGPYFPLARFGDYFVTLRDGDGAVTSFSRFEKEGQQQAWIRALQERGETNITFGTLDSSKKQRNQIDPSFVANIENMLAESGASEKVMDAVWQHWLETLPDQSIRTSKIHRKGRSGYGNDAFRAFGKHMFHGAHQLARLNHGLLLEEHLNDADEEARKSDNPNRAGLLVAEMRKRHDFTMDPSGSSVVASMSGAAFVWYLGASPAAALANISQTTLVGIPIMSARFGKVGVSGVTKALGRASKDFFSGRGAVSKQIGGVPVWTEQWTAENSPNLTDEERAAMHEAVRRGTIDKTQAHDLASVAETGIEYSATREKWMRRIGWFFHQAERFNREVTFLANYRLAKADGLDHAAAIDLAADLTWKIHFDYQNTSRPRFMQNDLGKVLTTFRQFTVNLIWRMFRDTHQMLNGATKEDRREARLQLVGVTLSMMAHAGIRGTWGYGLLMMLMGMLAPGADDDDIKEWLQDALLFEGDSMGVAAWNYAMGAALNGVPGQVLGVDLVERIGMPNLWFRDAPSDLEGKDLYSHYVGELLGPVYGIGEGFFRGAQLAADGNWWRGTEAAVPKVIRDGLKTVRYLGEGVQTLNGDILLDGINPYQALLQVNGFTPAKIAERYDINSRLKDQERKITGERTDIQKEAAAAILAGQEVPESVMEQIKEFNARFPEYPITSDTIRQSARSKLRAQERSEFGIVLNAKLNDRLRAERATEIYN